MELTRLYSCNGILLNDNKKWSKYMSKTKIHIAK
jgi:hypothetical protein